jgi:hypothetical protein
VKQPPSVVLATGDPLRAQLRRALWGSLALAALFTLSTGPVKQYSPLYSHAPWLNDPFDTVVSFMMFFVPLVAGCCVVRIPLCRRYVPLATTRARDLLRGCQIILAGVALTLSSEWVALALRANRAAWSDATVVQVVILVVMSIFTVLVARDVALRGLRDLSRVAHLLDEPDALGDAVASVMLRANWFGPLRTLSIRFATWFDARALSAVRRHPLWCTAALWAAFAAAVGVRQSLGEGYTPGVALLFMTLLGSGMFGLCVLAGSYLGIVRVTHRLEGARRRGVDAMVATCVGVLVPFALRYHLWWVVGSRNSVAGPSQLAGLLCWSAFVIFAATFAAETVLGRHNHSSTRD